MRKQNDSGEFEFGIHEVYYNDNGEANGWTENSLTPVCSSVEDLFCELEIMMKAFEKEALEYGIK